MSLMPTQRGYSRVRAFVMSIQERLNTVADGVESASARCPFDMGTTPLNDWLEESERAAATTTLPIKTSN